jgi:preprotein translocase subunit SecE
MKEKGEKSLLSKISGWFSDIAGEFKKIIWPSRKELVKQTGTVIFTSAIFGVIILALNGVFSTALSYFVKYLG